MFAVREVAAEPNLHIIVNSMVSRVEKIALARGAQKKLTLNGEKIGVIVVDSFPALGTLAALRFLEWLQENSEGVVSLPTGKSPQYFIREVTRFVAGWREKSIQRELAEGGVDHNCQPDLRGLHFVQIDEFYPINPKQHNSFYYFVNKYYLKGFGLNPAKALLINCNEIGIARGEKLEEVWPEGLVDLTLRSRMGVDSLERKQKNVIENIDQWCTEYEEKIRRLGGIGFFLEGIGPDGHIGFNIRGFTAVTNAYMYGQLNKLRSRLFTRPFALLVSENYFEPNNGVYRNRDVWQYLDGVAAGDCGMRNDGEARRLLRNLIAIYGESGFEKLKERIELLLKYFIEAYPGQKDTAAVQKLKGMTREWEADCLWGYFGWSSKFVRHLRLGFYKGDLFTQDPTFKRDILPVIRLLEYVLPAALCI